MFYFHPCGDDQSWRAYLSNGLKPPTSFCFLSPSRSFAVLLESQLQFLWLAWPIAKGIYASFFLASLVYASLFLCTPMPMHSSLSYCVHKQNRLEKKLSGQQNMGAVATCFLLADSSPTWRKEQQKNWERQKKTPQQKGKRCLYYQKNIYQHSESTWNFKMNKKATNFHSESLGFMAIAPKNHGISSHWWGLEIQIRTLQTQQIQSLLFWRVQSLILREVNFSGLKKYLSLSPSLFAFIYIIYINLYYIYATIYIMIND